MSFGFQESFQASKEDASKRLDVLLKQKFPEYSRSYFQYLIENAYITIDRVPVKKRQIVAEGELIEVFFSSKEILKARAENLPLTILYEDDYLIAINKPRGQVVHPAPGHTSKTLVNALLFHFEELIRLDALRPGIVHRLDKDTSGVIIIAKDLKTHEALSNAFKERNMKKTYLALCLGHPREQIIEGNIGRDPSNRKAMGMILEGGRSSFSKVTTLEHKEGFSFVEIEPLTGRTHQIRVHLQSVGCPILGDPLYGAKKINEKLSLNQQMLHAKSLSFTHPFTNELITVQAEMPEDMILLKEKLFK